MMPDAPRSPAWRPLVARGPQPVPVAGRAPAAALRARDFARALRRRHATAWRRPPVRMRLLTRPRAAQRRAAWSVHLHLRPSVRFVMAGSSGWRPNVAPPRSGVPRSPPRGGGSSRVLLLRTRDPAREVRTATNTTRVELRTGILPMALPTALRAGGGGVGHRQRPAPPAWTRPVVIKLVRRFPAGAPAPPEPRDPQARASEAVGQRAAEFRAPLAAAPWAAGELPLGRAQVERLTEEVMRGIDRRFVALRERMGRG